MAIVVKVPLAVCHPQYTSHVGEKVRISEIFASVQGEGLFLGTPSVFVRVSGCNLRCTWCDTPYASWNPEGPVLDIDQIVDSVKGHSINHVVLTGGEPMLFDAIDVLAARLSELGMHITIETAGTVSRDLPCDLMSISPKLSNSTPDLNSGWSERHEATRLNRQPLRRLIQTYNIQLKFVVGSDLEQDISEIESLLLTLPSVDPDRVLLMPEGTDSETLHRRMKQLVPICMERNWRLAPRLHVDLFGNTRGT